MPLIPRVSYYVSLTRPASVPESRIRVLRNLPRAGLQPDGQADRERDAERQLQPPRLAERLDQRRTRGAGPETLDGQPRQRQRQRGQQRERAEEGEQRRDAERDQQHQHVS